VSGRSSFCFLSGRAGLRCLNLFSGLCDTTEVVPFHESGFRAVSPPTLFCKEREKRMGHPLGWWELDAGSLDFARDDMSWCCAVSRCELHLNWCKNVFLAKCCQAPWGARFSVSYCAEREYIFEKLAGLPYSSRYHRSSGFLAGLTAISQHTKSNLEACLTRVCCASAARRSTPRSFARQKAPAQDDSVL
jgi:hypothetical protein